MEPQAQPEVTVDAELAGVLAQVATLCQGPKATAYCLACNDLLNDALRDTQSDPTFTQALVEFCAARQPPGRFETPVVVQSAKTTLRQTLAIFLPEALQPQPPLQNAHLYTPWDDSWPHADTSASAAASWEVPVKPPVKAQRDSRPWASTCSSALLTCPS